MNFPPLDEASLRTLIQRDETDNLEFKARILSNSQVAEYVVGMGNAGGGFLIFGVTDKKPRQIVGIEEPNLDRLQKIRRSIYDSTDVRVELETVNTREGFVLAIRIPPRPQGTVLHTSDGKFLIRVGEDLVGLTTAQIGAMLAESSRTDITDELLPLSLRFTEMQHSQHYSMLVKNDSDVEIQPTEVWLEKDGLKLADPARKAWPSIPARSAAMLSWQPNRNPADLFITKWLQKMIGKPIPAQSFTDEIDLVVSYTVPGGRRKLHRERIMVLVDRINKTMLQWS